MANKDALLQFRVTPDEKMIVEKAATKQDLKPAQWIRQTVLQTSRRVLGLP